MSRETIYLIDTNSLITPKNSYYPFDIAPEFWKSMAEKIEEGSIAILDLVKKEILKPAKKDDLANWMESLTIRNISITANKTSSTSTQKFFSSSNKIRVIRKKHFDSGQMDQPLILG